MLEIGPKINLVRTYHAPPTNAIISKILIRTFFKSFTVLFGAFVVDYNLLVLGSSSSCIMWISLTWVTLFSKAKETDQRVS